MIKLFITLLIAWLAAYVFTLAAEQVIKYIIERRRKAQALAQRERHNKRVARAIRRNRAEYYASEIDNEYFKILMREMYKKSQYGIVLNKEINNESNTF